MIKIINEKTGNPFPSKLIIDSRINLLHVSPISTEGYHHNEKLIKKTVKELLKIIKLPIGNKTIDIGYGTNLSIGEAMNEMGMKSYGLDSKDGLDKKHKNILFVPPYFNIEEKAVKKYCGTIEDILHHNSELKNEKFDLFTFWGSFESSGNNYAICGEMGDFRAQYDIMTSPKNYLDYDNEKIQQKKDENQYKILEDVRDLLNKEGGILVVSPRYAYHGGGFPTKNLPFEKRRSMRLLQMLEEIGVNEFYLVGLSNEKVQKELKNYSRFANISRKLLDNEELFSQDNLKMLEEYTKEDVSKLINKKIPLGRIDAIYGKFN